MFGEPVQLAYAVTDVRSAARRWVDDGIGPFFIVDHIGVRNVRVRGEPGVFDHSSAYAWWGSVMVELICQHDGGTHAIVGRAGLHHVAFFVDDFAAAAAALSSRGDEELLYAETAGGMPFAFHDARATLGHHVEIYERVERIAGFYGMVRDASLGWDGADAIRVF